MSDQRLRHLLDESERVLTAGGVWSPRSDATELAAHVMGVRTDAPLSVYRQTCAQVATAEQAARDSRRAQQQQQQQQTQ